VHEGGARRKGKRAGGRAELSIITVSYNAEAALRRTLDSVAAQSWDAIEQIVVDGGSMDGTRELLEARDDDIAAWRSAPDAGIYDAMNLGLRLAEGEYVLFLNSGDYLEGRVLHPDLDPSRLLPVRMLDFWGRQGYLKLRDLRLGMPYCHQGILFRNRDLVPFDTRLRIAADYEFLLANLERAGMATAPRDPIGCVVFDASGVSNTRVRERDIEAAGIVRQRFGLFHWLRFWGRQGPKLVVRWVVSKA
jgi:glycosyltransferase involved in cell wall biosynthesis